MRSPFVLAILTLAACGAEPGARCPTPVALADVQAHVLYRCALGANGCHMARPYAANLDLTRADAWSSLVHAPSSSSPGKFLVEPGDLSSSFLWQKLNDELAGDGSEGVPMPRDANDQWARLSDAQLDVVGCWIRTGAAP